MLASGLISGLAPARAGPGSSSSRQRATAADAAAAAASPRPRSPVGARLAALARRVGTACAYRPEDRGEGNGDLAARAARLLSAKREAPTATEAAAPLAASAAPPEKESPPPAALLEQLRRLLPEDDDDQHHHQHQAPHNALEPLLDATLAQWPGVRRRPASAAEADAAARGAADLLRAAALLRLHPRRDARALRATVLATHAVATRMCSPGAVAAALSAWVAAFEAAAVAAAAPVSTPARSFFGPLGEPAACASLSDGELVAAMAAMARLPPRRTAIAALGLELQRRIQDGVGESLARPLSLPLLPRLPQLLQRGLPPSCAAALLRAASAHVGEIRPHQASALLLALRPLVAWAGEEDEVEAKGEEEEEDDEAEGARSPLQQQQQQQQQQSPVPAQATVPLQQPMPIVSSAAAPFALLPRPEWSRPADPSAPADDADGDAAWGLGGAAEARRSLASSTCTTTMTMADVHILAEDLARRLARQARRGPLPLRAAPPLPPGLAAAALATIADADSPDLREAALRAAEDILAARFDQLAAALPLCTHRAQVLAACEGAVRALALPPLAAAAARSPRCRASSAGLLRGLEAAAFCDVGVLDLAQRMLLLRALDALRWAANADVLVGARARPSSGGSSSSGSGSSNDGGGTASAGADAPAPPTAGSTVALRDDAFTAGLRQDLARELAGDAPLGAVVSAFGALSALRLPPPADASCVAAAAAPSSGQQKQQDADVEQRVVDDDENQDEADLAQQPPSATPSPPPPGWDSLALLRVLVARVRSLPLAPAARLLHAMASLGYVPPRQALDYALEPLCRDRHHGGELDALFAAAADGAAADPARYAAPAADAEGVQTLLLALGRLSESHRAAERLSSLTQPAPLVSRRVLKRVLLAHGAASCRRLGPRALLAAGRAARLAAAPFFPATPGDVWAVAWVRRLRACAAGGQMLQEDACEAALLMARLDWAPAPGGSSSSAASSPNEGEGADGQDCARRRHHRRRSRRRHAAWERQLWQALEPARRDSWGPALASALRVRLETLARERAQLQRRRGGEAAAAAAAAREADAERRALLWAALKHGLAPARQRPEWARAFVGLAARAGPNVAPHVAAAVLGAWARSTFASLLLQQQREREERQQKQPPTFAAATTTTTTTVADRELLRQQVASLAAVVADGADALEGAELLRALHSMQAAEAALGALERRQKWQQKEGGVGAGSVAAPSALSSLPPMPLERRRLLLRAALDQVPRMTNPPPAVAAALLDLLASGPLRAVTLLPAAAVAAEEAAASRASGLGLEGAARRRGDNASLARAWINHVCALAVAGEEEEQEEDGRAPGRRQQQRVPLSPPPPFGRPSADEGASAATTAAAPFFPPWAPQSRRWRRAPVAAALLRALRASPELAEALAEEQERGSSSSAPVAARSAPWGGAARLLASAAEEPGSAGSSVVASDLSAAVTSAAFLELAGFNDEDEKGRGTRALAVAAAAAAAADRPASSSSLLTLRPREALSMLAPSAVLADSAPSEAAEMLAAMARRAAAAPAAADAAASAAASPRALVALAALGRRAASWALLRALSAPLGRVGRAAASSATASARGRAAFERAVVVAEDGPFFWAAPPPSPPSPSPPPLQEEEETVAGALWAETSRAALELRLARLLREAVAVSSSRLCLEAGGGDGGGVVVAAEQEEQEAEDDGDDEDEQEAAEGLLRVWALGGGGDGGLVRALDLRMASLARRALVSA